jgi:hypothetical protein
MNHGHVPDIYVPQKRGYVLSPPTILSQVDMLKSSNTNKISSHKQYFLQDKPPNRKQNRRNGDVFSSREQLFSALEVQDMKWTGDSGSNPERAHGDTLFWL